MRKGKHVSPNETIQDLIDQGEIVGPLMHSDANAQVIAKGDVINTDVAALAAKKLIVENLEIALLEARVVEETAKATFILSYNAGVDKANEIYPHNEAKLTGLGIVLTEENHKRPVPGKVDGCSVVQGDHTGQGLMHMHKESHSDSYQVMETQSADITNEAVYYPANPTSFNNSRGGVVYPKNKDIKTTYRIFGRNTTGDGVWSDPFGGFPFH